MPTKTQTANDLIERCQEARRIKGIWKQMEERFKLIELPIIELMQKVGQKRVSWQEDGIEYFAEWKQAEVEVIDSDKLKKMLGAKEYTKLCTPMLDKAKLENAMATGEVSPHLVAACSTPQKRKPYLQFPKEKKVAT